MLKRKKYKKKKGEKTKKMPQNSNIIGEPKLDSVFLS